MARFLIAGTPVPGHIAPLLAVARHLIGRGHELVFYTASVFRERVEATGANFVPFPREIDLDYRRLDEHFPERAELPPGPAQLIFGLKHLFADAMPEQCRGLREIMAGFPADSILIDTMFCGAMPLLLAGQHRRPPIVALGITALAWSSEDTAFFGTALPPPTTPAARARSAAMTRYVQQNVYGEVQAHFDAVLAKQDLPALPHFLFDSFISLPDLYLQLTAETFEYPRRDLPRNVRFIGPLLPPPGTQFEQPDWWSELNASRPVVLVTQGTLANTDLAQLVGPTLTALADDGDRIFTVREVPHNWLFRRVRVAVHHGGAGTTAAAIRAGIPSVVVPFLADQPFWAWHMERLGIAPPRLSHKALTAERLAEAITVATGERMRQRARQLGSHVAEEGDVQAEIAALAQWGLLQGSS